MEKPFLHPIRLLKKARESWDYFATDELVYIVENVDLLPTEDGMRRVEKYLNGEAWIELSAKLAATSELKEAEMVALIEVDGVGQGRTVNYESSFAKSLGQYLMLFGIPQIMENPEKFRFRPIRTRVWLKSSQFGTHIGKGIVNSLRIGLSADGHITVFCPKVPVTPFESIDVLFRPFQFEVGATRWFHDLYYQYEQERRERSGNLCLLNFSSQ